NSVMSSLAAPAIASHSWADVSNRYGTYTPYYNRFARWQKASLRDNNLGEMLQTIDDDIIMIDSSFVRVHQHAATGKGDHDDGCSGRSCGGLTTKIHAVFDADGRPTRVALTAG